MEKLVIGIDFSKETVNYFCFDGRIENFLIEGVVENSVAGCKEMIRQLRSLKPGIRVRDFLFCGENTGFYSLTVSDYLYAKKYFIWLENPLQIKLSSGLRREKTDKADARMIAEYALRYQDKARAYNPNSQSIQKLKGWLKAHNTLRDSKTALANVISTMPEVPATLKKALEEIKEQLKETDKQIKKLLETDEELAPNAKLIISVPGISYISAAAFLIDTRNFTRFSDARKYANHAGCVPHRHESGTSIYKNPRTSKASNRCINSLLTEGARSLMTHNKETQEYVRKKTQEGKCQQTIVNNVRNKIIHRMFAVIRDRVPFDKDYINNSWRNEMKDAHIACQVRERPLKIG